MIDKTQVAELLIDGPAQRRHRRRAETHLEREARAWARRQDVALAAGFPAGTVLDREDFDRYAELVIRQAGRPATHRHQLTPPWLEDYNSAILDILDRGEDKQAFPSFEAFRTWLRRWAGNLHRRVKYRPADMMDVSPPGEPVPFLTQKQPRTLPITQALRAGAAIIELSDTEARLRGTGDASDRLDVVAWNRRIAVAHAIRVGHYEDNQPAVASNGFWTTTPSWARPLARPLVFPSYKRLVATTRLPTEHPEARERIDVWSRSAYPNGVARFDAITTGAPWRHRNEYERPVDGDEATLMGWITRDIGRRVFERQATKQWKDRFTMNPERNPHESDRGWRDPRPSRRAAPYDRDAFEVLGIDVARERNRDEDVFRRARRLYDAEQAEFDRVVERTKDHWDDLAPRRLYGRDHAAKRDAERLDRAWVRAGGSLAGSQHLFYRTPAVGRAVGELVSRAERLSRTWAILHHLYALYRTAATNQGNVNPDAGLESTSAKK